MNRYIYIYMYIYIYISSDWGMFINPMFIGIFFYPCKNPIHDEHETYTIQLDHGKWWVGGSSLELLVSMLLKRGALQSKWYEYVHID